MAVQSLQSEMSDNRGVDSDEELIDCNGVGGILFVDQDDRKFYAEYQANDLNVKIGDCVRIKLADTSSDGQFGFAQILAIYERQDEEMYIEVRWLSQGHELAAKHRKMFVLSLLTKSFILDCDKCAFVCIIITSEYLRKPMS